MARRSITPLAGKLTGITTTSLGILGTFEPGSYYRQIISDGTSIYGEILDPMAEAEAEKSIAEILASEMDEEDKEVEIEGERKVAAHYKTPGFAKIRSAIAYSEECPNGERRDVGIDQGLRPITKEQLEPARVRG